MNLDGFSGAGIALCAYLAARRRVRAVAGCALVAAALCASPAVASTVPAIDLEAGHGTVAVGTHGSFYGGGDFAVGPVVLGVSAAQKSNFVGEAYVGGRVTWRIPGDADVENGYGLMLAGGTGNYQSSVQSNVPGSFGPTFAVLPWVEPAAVWGKTWRWWGHRCCWRGSLGPVFGLDGRLWSLPALSGDVSIVPALPFALNMELGVELMPRLELTLLGDHGPGIGLRARI